MNYFLHIDTTGNTATIALSAGGILSDTVVTRESRNHASEINILIDQLLAQNSITLADVTAIAVCGGPGSYTGLRIGLSTAKGLCYALDIPLMMHSKLTLLAMAAFKTHGQKFEYYLPVLKAREKEYFTSIYNNRFENITVPVHVSEEELDDILSKHTNSCTISNDIPEELASKYIDSSYVSNNTEIDMQLWAFYSLEEFKCNNTVNLSTAEPFYLKQVYTHK
ncbi:MAG: tRNA (adenosine(37)-N6)-threonylcarbamoyltransferase complex dimerization subunit type 1 TsaB [Taibaiella sp.]|nr:tRNA (adenosine(37)-N6)-threonylcarbamoyltransferase complex dimerization subunit type 1 TsaB [Taibaiella sp.]